MAIQKMNEATNVMMLITKDHFEMQDFSVSLPLELFNFRILLPLELFDFRIPLPLELFNFRTPLLPESLHVSVPFSFALLSTLFSMLARKG